MNVRINQGYVITDSIHIGKAEFVIGEMSNTPAPFVTWECKDGNNYFWGHYLTTRSRLRSATCWSAQFRNWSIKPAGRPRWSRRIPLGRNPDP